MKDVVIWDLDGTLSDGRGRLHLLPRKLDVNDNRAWDEFNLAAGDDLPFVDNIELCNSLYKAGYQTIILTGRGDVSMQVTKKWLWEHGVDYHRLIMRSAFDNRKDVKFKEYQLRIIGLDRILCAFDDLEHVATHLRDIGVTCHLVAPSNKGRQTVSTHNSI